jgi:hypothetical protein
MRLGLALQLVFLGALITGVSFMGCNNGTSGSNDLAQGGPHDFAMAGVDLAGVDFSGADLSGGCAGKDLMNDSANCGRCGRSCGVGVCALGRCPLVTIESNQPHPVGVAVDATSVYWTNYGDGTNGSVNYDLLAGGSPMTITNATGLANVGGIAISGTKLVWAVGGATDGSGKVGISVNKATAQDVVTGENYPLSIVTDGTTVFWTAYGTSAASPAYSDGALRKANAVASSTASNVGNATGLKRPAILFLSGTTIFFSEEGTSFPSTDGRINKIPTTGAVSPTNIAMTQATPFGVAADATNVYWCNSSGTSVLKAPVAGGGSMAIGSSQKNPSHILVDSTGVYWTNEGDPDGANPGYFLAGTGSVMYLPLAGGTPIAFATGQNDPVRIVSDAGNIYWVNQGTAAMTDGQVMKTPE